MTSFEVLRASDSGMNFVMGKRFDRRDLIRCVQQHVRPRARAEGESTV